jgi:hypothetical protein
VSLFFQDVSGDIYVIISPNMDEPDSCLGAFYWHHSESYLVIGSVSLGLIKSDKVKGSPGISLYVMTILMQIRLVGSTQCIG